MGRIATRWPSCRRASPLPAAMRPAGLTAADRRALAGLVERHERREAARGAFSEAELARLRDLCRRYHGGRPGMPAADAAA